MVKHLIRKVKTNSFNSFTHVAVVKLLGVKSQPGRNKRIKLLMHGLNSVKLETH